MNEVKFLLEKINIVIAKVISDVFSHLFCIFGIGLISFVARIMGKMFLHRKYKDSSWLQVHKSEKLTKQY